MTGMDSHDGVYACCGLSCIALLILLFLIIMPVRHSHSHRPQAHLIVARSVEVDDEENERFQQSGGMVGAVVRAAGHGVREYKNLIER